MNKVVIKDTVEDVLENRVNEGFAWFALNEPDILREADLETLDMGNDCHCLLGQAFGSFEHGLESLEMFHSTAIEMGLDTWTTEPWYPAELTPYWKTKIEAWRLDQART